MNGKIPLDKYRDKIVLIGPTAAGRRQLLRRRRCRRRCRRSDVMAHAVSSILQEHFFVAPTWGLRSSSVLFLLVGAYLIVLLPRLKAGLAAGITAASSSSWLLVVHFVLMTTQLMWIQLMAAGRAAAGRPPALTTKRFLVTERGKVKSDGAPPNRTACWRWPSRVRASSTWPGTSSAGAIVRRRDGQSLQPCTRLRAQAPVQQGGVRVPSHGRHNPEVPDLERSCQRAKQMSETVILGGSGGRTNTSILEEGQVEKPMLGRYQVEKELGKGAMGVVYLGKDPKIGRVVAIKTMALSQEFEADELVGGEGALLPRGRDGRAPESPAHRHDLRRRRGARPRLHRDGVPEGRRSRAVHQAGCSCCRCRKVMDHLRARVADALAYAHKQQRGASRYQAGEHHVRPGTDAGQGHGFRHRAHHGFVKTKTGMVLGTPSLHVARATGRQEDRRPLRPVLARRHAVPAGVRQPAVPGRFDGPADVQDRQRGRSTS
jgi:hypothetical protein